MKAILRIQSLGLLAIALLISSAVAATEPVQSPLVTIVNPGKPVKVYILAGQSNMQGGGARAALSEQQRSTLPRKDIWYLWSDITKAVGTWEPLGTRWSGPELSFALSTAAVDKAHTTAVVKVSRSATQISYWLPGRKKPWNDRAGHGELLRMIDLARSDLNARVRAGVIPCWQFAGLVWVQGAGDANGVMRPAGTYLKQLRQLVAIVRQQTGIADLPVVIGRVSIQLSPKSVRDTGTLRESKQRRRARGVTGGLPDNVDYVDDGKKRGPIWFHENLLRVRSDQESFVRQDKKTKLFSIDDLPLRDAYHYDGKGYFTIGQRFSDALQDLIKFDSNKCAAQ